MTVTNTRPAIARRRATEEQAQALEARLARV